MIADPIRLPAYRDALAKAIRPGDSVADIGTGPGVVAVMACQLGAGHVYALEPNEAIQVAREVAQANGVADRITFLQAVTTQVTPPRRCDVLVSDLRGCVPYYERHIPTIVDARARWLVPGGRQIPQRDAIHGALVEAESVYADFSEPWRKVGMDLEAVRRRTVNAFGKCRLRPENLLSASQPWAELDYRTIVDPNASRTLRFVAGRPGTAHGLALWFDTELFEGVGFSNAPGQPELIYGQVFFPFAEPIAVQTGETMSVDLRAQLVHDDYVWQWTTAWSPSDPARGPAVRHQQSSFFGVPVSAERLRPVEQGHRPRLNAEGRLERDVLGAMTGERSVEELARQLLSDYPGRFANEQQALEFVRDRSTRFSA